MRTSTWIVPCRQWRLILSVSALALLTCATDAAAATSEIDSFEVAVTSQDKRAALAFIDEFPSSHLVGDLIELLRPEVAHEVCAALPSGGTTVRDECRKLDVRLATPQTATGQLQANPSRESSMEFELHQSAAQDATGNLGIGDTAISPAAGSVAPTQELASTTARTRGTTGERPGQQLVTPLLPSEANNSAESADDTHAKKPASSDEPDNAPKPPHDPGPPVPGLGSDPGSDSGSATSPSSHGKDPGSDPGSDAGGNDGHDSHN